MGRSYYLCERMITIIYQEDDPTVIRSLYHRSNSVDVVEIEVETLLHTLM